MSREKRLGRLEAVAAKVARQRSQVPVRVVWQAPDGEHVDIGGSPSDAAMTIRLTSNPDTVAARRRPRGQRPRQPTEGEREAALAQLRERARRGQYIGVVPASADELAAEHHRREVLRRDTALIRHTSR